MVQTASGEVCRLQLTGPTSRVELSVPTHVPLMDLMPALLRSLGQDLPDRGLEHGGWVLQRLGEAPLDEDLSVDDHGLLDGDALHLRPRSDQIPPLDFDDLVDGVATGAGLRSGLWRPQTTRLASLLALHFWLLAALVLPLLGGPPPVRAAAALGAALLLAAATQVAVRVLSDRAVAYPLAAGCVAFAAQAAAIGVSSLTLPPAQASTLPVLAAVTAAVLVAIGMLALLDDREPMPAIAVGVGTAGAAAVAGCAARLLWDTSWAQLAGAVLVLVALLRPTVPFAGFKLAGLTLPELPVEPEDLQKDIDPQDGREVLARTAAADRQMTALYTATGLCSGASMLVLAALPGVLPSLAVVLAALAHLLASRPMTSAWHRLAMGLPAVAGLTAVAWGVASRGDTGGRVLVLLAALLLAFAAAAVAHSLPRRRMTPWWGRIGDWTHLLALSVLVPVVAGILGWYSLVRSVVG